LRLNRLFGFALYGAFGVLFLSGAGWLIADSLKDSKSGEAWQAFAAKLLMVHGGMAMLALMLIGALFPVHVLKSWRAKKNLATGITVAILNATLIITAFGLYYIGSEDLRPWMSNLHLALGLALPVVLSAHIYFGRRSSARSKMVGRAIPIRGAIAE
jgi:hypothetical protein